MFALLLSLIAFAAEPTDAPTGAACPMPKSFGAEADIPAPASKPALDLRKPAHTETATFALG